LHTPAEQVPIVPPVQGQAPLMFMTGEQIAPTQVLAVQSVPTGHDMGGGATQKPLALQVLAMVCLPPVQLAGAPQGPEVLIAQLPAPGWPAATH
jgi:hypothetical protein